MHKRNITITALVVAAVITAAFIVFPRLNHSTGLGVLYFPSILVAVMLSGGTHSPSALAGWSSFVVWTLFYGAVFLVLYAFLLEIYLLRRVLHTVDAAKPHLLSSQPDPHKVFEKLGQAISEIESRRRRHFLLKNMDMLDLSQPSHLLAAQAISKAGKAPPVKRLLKRLESSLTAEVGPDKAADLMAKLRDDANTISSQSPGTGYSSPAQA